MGVLDKCCENCHHISCLDTDNIGLCRKSGYLTCRDDICSSYIPNLNGWIELTPDNVDENNADLIVVTDGIYYKMANDWHASLSTLAKVGGYYYYVLPELKIE